MVGLRAVTHVGRHIAGSRRDIALVRFPVTPRRRVDSRLSHQLAVAGAAIANDVCSVVHAGVAAVRHVELTGGLISIGCLLIAVGRALIGFGERLVAVGESLVLGTVLDMGAARSRDATTRVGRPAARQARLPAILAAALAKLA